MNGETWRPSGPPIHPVQPWLDDEQEDDEGGEDGDGQRDEKRFHGLHSEWLVKRTPSDWCGQRIGQPSMDATDASEPNCTPSKIVSAGDLGIVMAGHSRSKNGVASLAYVPAIHVLPAESPRRRGCPHSRA